MADRTPTTVVTGFLGAGKTTLIRHLLADAGGRRIALIVNEFGDLGVDGATLEAARAGCGDPTCAEDDIVELANGCICCTVADDFIPTMTKLLDRDAPPDHIVIETSGLALPQPLVRAFNWPEIRGRVTVDGVVAVIDGAAVADGRFAADEGALEAQRAADDGLDHETPLQELFEDQLACADLIVLNKTDLIDAERRDEIEAQLKAQARAGVGLVAADHGRLPAAALLGLDMASETDVAVRGERHHHHDHDHDHDHSDLDHAHDHGHDHHHHHHHHHHDHGHDAFESVVTPVPEIVARHGFEARLASALADIGALRAKGYVRVAGKPFALGVQAVGPRVDAAFDRSVAAEDGRVGRLVVIGLRGLDGAAIAAAVAAAAGARAEGPVG